MYKLLPQISSINSKLILFLLLFVMATGQSFGQTDVGKRVSISFENKRLIQVLYDLSVEHEIQFFFEPDDLPYYPLTGSFDKKPIYDIIKDLTEGTSLIVIPYDKKEGLFVLNRPKANAAYLDNLITKWEDGTYDYPFDKNAKELSYTFGKTSTTKKQAKLRLKLFDQNTNEAIIGAVISNTDLSINGLSGPSGNINLELPVGQYDLTVSYIGYQSTLLHIDLYDDGRIKLPMNFQSFLFQEIEVLANSSEQQLSEASVGREIINLKSMEAIPQILGEIDIIKSLETLPGVTSAGELSIGFNVRGGKIDESLVLFNDGIIFNPTHIVGFISAFNADALDNATLYKAYMDPEFGGRGSAVLDLKSDATDVKGWKGKGGLGTSMMKIYVEGPISKKLDFHASGRGSFNDYLLKLVANPELRRSNANFYDFNSGFAFQINDQHKLVLNTYYSNDLFEFNDEFGFKWSNQHLGLQWKSSWSEKLFSSLSLNYGAYDTDNFTKGIPEAASFKTGLFYYKIIGSVNRKIGADGFIKTGVEVIDFNNRSDRLEPSPTSTITENSIQRKAGLNVSPFLTFQQKISRRISFETGLRFSNYFSNGPGKIFSYSEGPKTEDSIIEEEELNGQDESGNYHILEPRVSVNYNFMDNWSLKGSYTKMSQNMFQLGTTNTTLPSDIWIFTDRHIKPLIVNQFALGLFTKYKKYSLGVDLFSKNSRQLYELQGFSEVVLNEHLETELIEAEGRSYGLEVLLKKETGKWKGNIAYTFSRSLRKTIDANKSLNQGTEFPSDFDIPHQLNILASYQALPVISFNFAYIFKSGRPTTVPSSTIIQDGFVVPLYSFRNQERIPYYSRLDFSITLDLRKVKQTGLRNSFTLGFYNLTGRNNANNVFFRRSAKGNIVPFQFAVVGSVIPNLSWNFVF